MKSLNWAMVFVAMALPNIAFTISSVILFLKDKYGPAIALLVFAFLTVPSIHLNTPKE